MLETSIGTPLGWVERGWEENCSEVGKNLSATNQKKEEWIM